MSEIPPLPLAEIPPLLPEADPVGRHERVRSDTGSALGTEIRNVAPGPLPRAAGGYGTILADPPWRFANRTGKVAPEHRRLARYPTLTLGEISALPVAWTAAATAHLYLWVPNALLEDGLAVVRAWGFRCVTDLVWYKVRADGGPDRRGVGFYFRNVTEILLFGVRGRHARTLAPARRQENLFATRKREHSRKPDEQYQLIEACSPPPYLELFARGTREGWTSWGDQADGGYRPTWKTYAHHSAADKVIATE
jgi:N6-adenosine-specific RNA methylase IME4